MRSSDETLLRYAGNALEAARRGVKLTSQLLAFTRSQSLEISSLDINSLIRGMDDLLRRSLGSDVTLVMDLEANLPPALGNAAQLELAILNLAVNGRDAMIDKGQLTISTRTEAADLFSKGQQSRVIVTVRDNGSGIEPEILEHVFEPFFTTKKPGKGTGLGLAQVRSIARQCGGGVTIDSTVGMGTSVNILLPVSAGYQAEKESDPMLALPVKGSSEIILVIDDDADVRRYLVESLTSLAYIVFDAPDGQSGLKMLDEMCPDLLIVDYVMPGLSGLQVIQKITETCPEMPVILTSGYSEAETLSDGAGSIRFLPKPFTATELSHAVRNALNAHNSARKDTPISHVA
jgi:CheY-like chemotaxis protein/two-component sensor histidine kinase